MSRLLSLLERANPGGQSWDNQVAGSQKALTASSMGKTIFEAA